jgi:hypothetical protein
MMMKEREMKKMMGKSMAPGGGGRFAKLKAKLSQQGVRNPAGLAAKIGRKKYGGKKMAEYSAKGRLRAKMGR